MSSTKFRKREQEYFILPVGKPRYFEPNSYTGSKRMCKYRIVAFIWHFDPHFPLGIQIKRLKRKYKRACVPVMNLRSVKLYGLWDL